jgi:branched-chain amino acid transport system permease protein
MRYQFKTDYLQDIRLFRWGGATQFWTLLAAYSLAIAGLNIFASEQMSQFAWIALATGVGLVYIFVVRRAGGDALWYGLVAIVVLTAPFILDIYFISQLTLVYIYAIAGVGLMLLVGQAGLISLGHAAFMACGAYVAAIMSQNGYDLLLVLPAAVVVSALLGVIVGLPALRMTGIYLGFATYAFAYIFEEILARNDAWTGGNNGLLVEMPQIFTFVEGFNIGGMELSSITIDSEVKLYFLSLAMVGLTMLVGVNILRSPTGRAFSAIRDSEIAAEALGVNLAIYKTAAFAISAGMAGLAGALNAYFLSYIFPEAFTILLSIELLVMVLVGGLGSPLGVVFGAIFIVMVPEMVAIAKDNLPAAIGEQPGLKNGVYGLILILFLIFEPLGIHGWWLKTKTYFNLFPLYKKGLFKRQKSYMVSERDR